MLPSLEETGHPVIRFGVEDPYDIARQFIIWEIATAVAAHRLQINPFDQPNVESAKGSARSAVDEYKKTGSLAAQKYSAASPEILHEFLRQAVQGDYAAIQAYITPNKEHTEALQKLRMHVGDTYRLATTVGYGPRYLHSTGQLHKGDSGNGLFIQITAAHRTDYDIPDFPGSQDSSLTFGILETAQANGDAQALLDGTRRIIRFHLEGGILEGILNLIHAVN